MQETEKLNEICFLRQISTKAVWRTTKVAYLQEGFDECILTITHGDKVRSGKVPDDTSGSADSNVADEWNQPSEQSNMQS